MLAKNSFLFGAMTASCRNCVVNSIQMISKLLIWKKKKKITNISVLEDSHIQCWEFIFLISHYNLIYLWYKLKHNPRPLQIIGNWENKSFKDDIINLDLAYLVAIVLQLQFRQIFFVIFLGTIVHLLIQSSFKFNQYSSQSLPCIVSTHGESSNSTEHLFWVLSAVAAPAGRQALIGGRVPESGPGHWGRRHRDIGGSNVTRWEKGADHCLFLWRCGCGPEDNYIRIFYCYWPDLPPGEEMGWSLYWEWRAALV